MNLGEIRAAVRSQTETTEDEISGGTITRWVRQAFGRTLDMETNWPFYEKTWELVQPAGATSIAAPSEVNWPAVESLRDMTTGYRLRMIDFATADDWFGGIGLGPTQAQYYSLWEGSIHLWPDTTHVEDRPFRLRGHRKPSLIWLTGADEDVPDCDTRLHECLVNYCISLAYAQQEDMELEDRYMQRWQRDFEAARASIMKAVHERPLILGPRIPTRAGGPQVPSWRINTGNG